jgi:hypothetical protein
VCHPVAGPPGGQVVGQQEDGGPDDGGDPGGHERSAYGIVTDLAAAGYIVKQKDGRRNRYQVQAHLPLPEPASREPAIGEFLVALIGDEARQPPGPQRLEASVPPFHPVGSAIPTMWRASPRPTRS